MTAPVRPPGREDHHCTCALGKCSRNGHSPLSAQCGHPGIYAHVRVIASQGTTTRSVCHRDACRLVAEKLTGPWRTQEAIGRAIGELTGVAGRKGGWIYDAAGRPIVQGWASYAHRMAGEVRVVDGRRASIFDFEPGRGYLIREAGLRRLANYLARLEARTNA